MFTRGKKLLTFLSTAMLLVLMSTGMLPAVTFESKPAGEGQGSITKTQSECASSKTEQKPGKPLLYSLELAKSHKERLAGSLNLMHLTGLQAAMAINMLKEIDGKSLPDNQILARLEYAHASLGAAEIAANKVKSDIDVIRIASGKDPLLRHEIALFFQDLLALPAMAEVSFSSSGSDSGGDSISDSSGKKDTAYHPSVMDPIQSVERIEVAEPPTPNAPIATIRPHGGFFESCMETIYSAAHSLGNVASKMKKDIGEGISSLTGAVGKAHTQIGNVVGQKNWANIMAGTKFVATTAGTVVALVVAAPVVASTAGMTGLMLATGVSFTGAGLSLVNDLQTIENENPDSMVKDLDDAVAKINQGTAFIGLASGSDTFVNLLGVTGGDLVASTPGQEMSYEQLAEFLDKPEHKNALKNQGFLVEMLKDNLLLVKPIGPSGTTMTDDQIWALFPTSEQVGMGGVQAKRDKSKSDNLSATYTKGWGVGISGRHCVIHLTLYGSDEISREIWNALRGTVKGETVKNVGDDAYIMDKGADNSYRAAARFRNASVMMTDCIFNQTSDGIKVTRLPVNWNYVKWIFRNMEALTSLPVPAGLETSIEKLRK